MHRCADWYCREPVVEGEELCAQHIEWWKDYRCPRCNSICIPQAGCPTYPQGSTWMRCVPACANATDWECSNDDCGWEYTEVTFNPTKNVGMERPEWMHDYFVWDDDDEPDD